MHAPPYINSAPAEKAGARFEVGPKGAVAKRGNHMSMEEKIVLAIGFVVGLAFGAMLMLAMDRDRDRTMERECEKAHNVYDCEWTRNPYTPAEPDE